MKVYYDQDADINALKGKTVAIIGYGSQGHAMPRTSVIPASTSWWGSVPAAPITNLPRNTASAP